jgi:hypothetical protein
MNLLDLIRHPHVYFEALKRLPPAAWRLAWLPVLSGLLAGVSGVLLSRSVLDAQMTMVAAIYGVQLPAAMLWVLTVVFGGAVSFVTWLILWGMAQLGTGREGRPGEVYAATFLAPLLWSLVLLVLVLLLPPQVRVAAPDLGGLKGQALTEAIDRYTRAVTAQYSASPVVRLSSVMNYAIYILQFWLAYIGFRAMTDDRARARKGVLYPGALLLLLGAVALLLASAAASLAGLF